MNELKNCIERLNIMRDIKRSIDKNKGTIFHKDLYITALPLLRDVEREIKNLTTIIQRNQAKKH